MLKTKTLLDGADVEIIGATYEVFDYGGNVGVETMAAHLRLKDLDSGVEWEQYWSVGDPEDYELLSDGNEIAARVHKNVYNYDCTPLSGLRRTSNWGIFLTKLREQGYPAERMTSKMSDLVGLRFRVGRIPPPPPKRGIIVPLMVLRLPWEKPW